MRSPIGTELHHTGRIGWLRATVLGANDGILSTASLVLGVAAAHGNHGNVMVAGIAGLVAGAMSMAAGEYVSVHSQSDTEEAELNLERTELKKDNKGEHEELMKIYVARGFELSLAKQVAVQLMNHDALGAHARDELGISDTFRARPIQAALPSAASFAVGAALPLLATALAPATGLIPIVSATSLLFLALLGGLAAHAGGARVAVGAIRVTLWGALAMGLTAGIGALVGTVVYVPSASYSLGQALKKPPPQGSSLIFRRAEQAVKTGLLRAHRSVGANPDRHLNHLATSLRARLWQPCATGV